MVFVPADPFLVVLDVVLAGVVLCTVVVDHCWDGESNTYYYYYQQQQQQHLMVSKKRSSL